MLGEKDKGIPIIKEMPIVKPNIWEVIRNEMRDVGEKYYWLVGSDLVKANPQHRVSYEEALRDATPNETPDATRAILLLVLKSLDMQAKSDGFQLPKIPVPMSPAPALREFIPRAQGEEWRLIDIAYGEILRTNPVIGEIVDYIAMGAPDEILRIATETQGKRGAVYAFYSIKAAIR